jgi:hypothetical protein
MKRLSLVLVLFLVLIFSVSVYPVPYPYKEYTPKTKGDLKAIASEMWDAYTVQAKTEGDSYYPWSNLSRATLMAPALIDAQINWDAEFELWTDTEKEQKRKHRFSQHIDDIISFSIGLFSAFKSDHDRRYVEIDSDKSVIRRIVLETDTGKRYTATIRHSMSSLSWSDQSWYASTYVSFPCYDNSVQIINENTKWIRLWVISWTERIYFQFNFDKW